MYFGNSYLPSSHVKDLADFMTNDENSTGSATTCSSPYPSTLDEIDDALNEVQSEIGCKQSHTFSQLFAHVPRKRKRSETDGIFEDNDVYSLQMRSDLEGHLKRWTQDGLYNRTSETHGRPNANMRIKNELKNIQRPRYARDGNRGCLKDKDDDPAVVEVQATTKGCLNSVIACTLLNENATDPAEHFEIYNVNRQAFSTQAGGATFAAKIQTLPSGLSNISLEWLGIRRKEGTDVQRAGRLKKDCRLLLYLFAIGEDPSQSDWLTEVARLDAGQIKCDQPPGRPRIEQLYPPDSDVGGGDLLLIKGKNLMSEECVTKVSFVAGDKRMDVNVINNMITKEVVACHIPNLVELSRPLIDIIVTVDDKESKPFTSFEVLGLDPQLRDLQCLESMDRPLAGLLESIQEEYLSEEPMYLSKGVY